MKFSAFFVTLWFLGISSLGAEAKANPFSDRILRVNFSPATVNFHPHRSESALEGQIFTGLYEGLMIYDPQTLRPTPGAAREWRVSDDRLTYTFILRPGLKFSDGTPLTAFEFRDSFLTLLDPRAPGKFASLLDEVAGAEDYLTGKSSTTASVGIKALDASTLEIRLKEPSPHILSILCHYAFSPVHPDLLRVSDWTHLKDIPGNGPYIISQRRTGHLDFKKNPFYWDADSVQISTIEMTFSEDKERVTKAFKDGYYDWLTDGMDFESLLNPESIVVSPLFASNYFYFRSDQRPWNDFRIRRALTLLLPLVDLRKNQLLPSPNLIPPFTDYPTKKGLESPDETEALGLLAEAGFPKGVGLPEFKILVPEGGEVEKAAFLAAEAWKEALKLPVTIETLPWDQYFQLSPTRAHNLGFQSWIGDFPDPMTFLLMWKTRSQLNTFGFSDEEFDLLLQKSRVQPSSERFENLSKAEELLLQRAALIPLGFSTGINIIDTESIGGWYANPLDIHPFKNLTFLIPKPFRQVVSLPTGGFR